MNSALRLIIISLLTVYSAGQYLPAYSPSYYSGAPAIANDDEYSTQEDIQLVIAVSGDPYNGILANDIDSEGDLLTAQIETGPLHGELVLNEDGSFTYTPVENWNGEDSFTYRAFDGTSFSNEATVRLIVEAVDDIPVAAADTYSTAEDTLLSVSAADGVLANDTQVDPEETLTAIQDTTPANGTLVLNEDGSFEYSPNLNFYGEDSFTYHASDGVNASDTVTVSVQVTAEDDPPDATADSYSTDEDIPLTVLAEDGVLANDSDAESDPMTATADTLPEHGMLEFNSDGSFTYTPAENWNGADQFTYHAVTITANSQIVTVTLNVAPVDDLPVAGDDDYSATEDVPLSVLAPGVLNNDSDIETPNLTAHIASQPQHGSVTLNEDGSFEYTPEENYNGETTFTYTSSDGLLHSAPATVTLTLAPENDPPVPVDDTFTATEDTTYTAGEPGVIANDLDVDNDQTSLTAFLVAGPEHGSLDFSSNGSFRYTPAENYNGSDSFTYYLSDPDDRSIGEGTVHLTITPVNDRPVTAEDSYQMEEDAELTINSPANGVLNNDRDVDRDTLTAVRVDGPSHGTLVLNEDGTFIYTPTPNFNGSDHFTYHASDGSLQSEPATVTLTVAPVNDAPVAGTQSLATAEDTVIAVTLTGSDVDQDELLYSIFTSPEHGRLTGMPPDVTYTPDLDYNGSDSFVFQVRDNTLTSSAAVYLTITPVNDAPVGVSDSYTISEDNPLLVSVETGLLNNDSDVDSAQLTAIPGNAPSHGTLTLNLNGSFNYTPVLNYNGPDTFTYRVSDNLLTSPLVTVTIVINPVNDAPVAGPGETYSTNEDLTLSVGTPGLLSNDNDVDGDLLNSIIADEPDHGEVNVLADGSFTYLPDANYYGRDTFSYTVSDGAITTLPIQVTITVISINDPPTTLSDEYYIGREGVLEVEAPGILENDEDVEGDLITVKSHTNPTEGEFEYFNPDGSFRYFTQAGKGGVVTFSYVATDGKTDAQERTVTIHLEPQSSATLNWISPISDYHKFRVGSEIVSLNVNVTIPEGFPCVPKDIEECNIPDLSFEVTDIVVRYYWYDNSVILPDGNPLAREIELVEGPPFRYNFDTSVLIKNRLNEIDAAATIRIIAKNSLGEPVGDPIFVTTAKKVIWLYGLPFDGPAKRLYFPAIIR